MSPIFSRLCAMLLAGHLTGCFSAPDEPGTPPQTAWVVRGDSLADYNLTSIHFPHRDTGYIVGISPKVLKTVDGGATWQAFPSGAFFFATVFFHDGRRGWAAGGNGMVYRTTDGGVTWDTAHAGIEGHARGLQFTDALTGYCVGDWGGIARSLDGGATWSRVGSGISDEELRAVHFPVADTGFVAGMHGTLLRTMDAGATWARLDVGTTQDLYAVKFFGVRLGYVAAAGGGYGSVYKTVDGGDTWVEVSGASAASQGHVAMHFIHPDTGWVAGDFGEMYGTVDGAATWTRQETGTPHTLRAVFFTGVHRGHAVGDAGVIIRTTTSGE